jgi:hypothetical protein
MIADATPPLISTSEGKISSIATIAMAPAMATD